MEDLHSIAFNMSSSCMTNYHLHTSSLLHDHLGLLNADISQYMDRSSSSAMSHNDVEFTDDLSTGYLEDVLFQFSSCKRRRLSLMLSEHDQDNLDCNSIMNCWTSDLVQNCYQNQNYDNLSQTTKSDMINSDMTKTGEEANSESYNDYSSSSANSHEKLESASADNQWTTPDQKGTDPIFTSGANGERKKRVQGKVAYPFALVKPGGFEGDMTLNDINERILMRPTRPVRHPVGDFACRPLASPNGPGLSGKAVVAFTRIHTPARGSITIIRTRG